MKPKICICRVDKDSFNLLYPYIGILNIAEQRNIMRYKYDIDKGRSLCGWLLAMSMLFEMNANRYPEVIRDAFNRPRIVGDIGMDMNISHDGDYVGCAIAQENIGFDIMDKRQIYEVSGTKSKQNEIDFINSLNPVLLREEVEFIGQDIDKLCKVWTAKEAYLKSTGTGFSDNVHVEYINGSYICKGVKIYHFEIDKLDHSHLAACTKKIEEQQIPLLELLSKLKEQCSLTGLNCRPSSY